MLNLVAVFIGGGIGSTLRWLVCKSVQNHYGTFIVNILGAFMIGVLFQYIAQKTTFNPTLKLFLMTGLLGGFTTFSTYLLDFVRLLNNNLAWEAVLYLLLSVLLGVAGLILGMKLVSF